MRSSVPGGHYDFNSGTAIATPLIAGTIAMLLEVNPFLGLSDLRQILQQTAVPLGEGRPNNTFGWGRVDALAAVEAALGLPPRTGQE